MAPKVKAPKAPKADVPRHPRVEAQTASKSGVVKFPARWYVTVGDSGYSANKNGFASAKNAWIFLHQGGRGSYN